MSIDIAKCVSCKHFLGTRKDQVACCKAYPDGIPDDIYWNRTEHINPISGDNGYLYEEITDFSKKAIEQRIKETKEFKRTH